MEEGGEGAGGDAEEEGPGSSAVTDTTCDDRTMGEKRGEHPLATQRTLGARGEDLIGALS